MYRTFCYQSHLHDVLTVGATGTRGRLLASGICMTTAASCGVSQINGTCFLQKSRVDWIRRMIVVSVNHEEVVQEVVRFERKAHVASYFLL